VADPAAEVVRTAQAMLARGLVAATQGNVSVRAGDTMWITPSARPYEPMTRGDVVPVSLAAPAPPADPPPSSEWRVHAAIYRARRDVAAIVHTHSVHATAWSHLGEDLALFSEDFPAPVRTAPYAATGTDGHHVAIRPADRGVVGGEEHLDLAAGRQRHLPGRGIEARCVGHRTVLPRLRMASAARLLRWCSIPARILPLRRAACWRPDTTLTSSSSISTIPGVWVAWASSA